jgi:hypothetical protein
VLYFLKKQSIVNEDTFQWYFFKRTVKQHLTVYWVYSLKQELKGHLNTNKWLIPCQQSCRHSQHVSLREQSRKHCRRLQSKIISSNLSEKTTKNHSQHATNRKYWRTTIINFLLKINKKFLFLIVSNLSLYLLTLPFYIPLLKIWAGNIYACNILKKFYCLNYATVFQSFF